MFDKLGHRTNDYPESFLLIRGFRVLSGIIRDNNLISGIENKLFFLVWQQN